MKILTNNASLENYLILAAVIFTIGASGLIFKRKNIINILMCVELMLLASSINFVAFSAYYNVLTGQIASIIILTMAAAEASIGLAIVVAYYRMRGSILVKDINELKG